MGSWCGSGWWEEGGGANGTEGDGWALWSQGSCRTRSFPQARNRNFWQTALMNSERFPAVRGADIPVGRGNLWVRAPTACFHCECNEVPVNLEVSGTGHLWPIPRFRIWMRYDMVPGELLRFRKILAES
jgi:hypothetical protein